jgi:hypothetical protein
MQSTKRNLALSSKFAKAPVSINLPAASATEDQDRRDRDRSFAIACTLGFVTVVFGFAALMYQFTPDFNKFRANSIQGAVPQASSLHS